MLESFLPLSYSGLQERPLDLSKTANLSADKDCTKMSDRGKSHLCAIDMEELLRTYLLVSNASEQPTACAAQFPIPTAHSLLSQSQAGYSPPATPGNLSILMPSSLPSAPTKLLSTSLQQPSAQAQLPSTSFQPPSSLPPLPSAQARLPSTSAYPPLTSAAAQLPSANCSHSTSILDLSSSPPQPSIPPSHICLSASSMQPNILSSFLPFFLIPPLNSPLLTADGFSDQQWLNSRQGSSENIAGEQHLSERALKLAERYDESAMVKRRQRQNERRLKAAKRSAVPAEACNCRFCYEDHILKLRQRAAVWSEG
jgi:hypothetical protein